MRAVQEPRRRAATPCSPAVLLLASLAFALGCGARSETGASAPTSPTEGGATSAEPAPTAQNEASPTSPQPEGSDAPESLGVLSQDAIRATASAHVNEIQFCYESGLARSENLAGRAVVAFTIGPDGSVTRAELAESTLGNDVVEACVVRRVQRWRFPAPDPSGSVQVRYPFVFSSRQ